MKKLFLILMVTLSTISINAQSGNAQQEINAQVWKPFIEAFSSYDADKFMSVHSKDMMRVTQDDKKLLTHPQYAAEMKDGDTRSKANKRKRDIELRFINRIAAADRAFEIGYYKTTSYAPDGTPRSFYGKFHVSLRKEDSQWKITLDTDTSKGVTEADFNAASPMN
ncbi:MAG: nuclear transport factor 2 family protein [Chitinophagaceae bacterium]